MKPGRTAIELETSWARLRAARAVREAILSYVLGPVIDWYTHPEASGLHHFQDLEYPAILAANHQSHLDTPVILWSLPPSWRRRTVVVAAADYFYRSRLKGMAVSLAFGTVPIQRTGASRTSTEHLEGLIRDGWNILLYPEGTRSREGKMGRLKTGAAHLALLTGVPIVPILVYGTSKAMPPGTRWPRTQPVRVHFGPPLQPESEEDARGLTGRLQESFDGLLAQASGAG